MSSSKQTPKKVVVLGGGTGIYPVTTALKHLNAAITTVVAVSDSGGSSGRIRDEFGFQPVGDLRQQLAAIAEGEGQDWIRRLLLYRFSKGKELKGHNLGNLILTALQDMTGNTTDALHRAQQIFRLEGQVVPATNQVVDLKISYEDGTSLVGEDYLNAEAGIEKQVVDISLVPEATATPEALAAIKAADLVIIGPGDYFGSVMASLLPKGIKAACKKSKAKFLYISNLMSRYRQTDLMKLSDYVRGFEAKIGRPFDVILVNKQPIPKKILAAYQKYHEVPVEDDLQKDARLLKTALLAEIPADQKADQSDALHRSFLRHDSQKLQKVLAKILT